MQMQWNPNRILITPVQSKLVRKMPILFLYANIVSITITDIFAAAAPGRYSLPFLLLLWIVGGYIKTEE